MRPYTTYENEICVWYRISSTMINMEKIQFYVAMYILLLMTPSEIKIQQNPS